MRTILSILLRLFLLLTVFCLVIFANGLATESPSLASINGSLRQIGNQQILDLWGSNYEMGYAHGYLMADTIRNLIEEYAIGQIVGGDVSIYKNFVNNLGRYTFYPQYLDEINGIVAGMIASGKNLYVPKLQRNIDARDVEAWNCFPELYFSCSSFGVWGSATANGETIIARNMDWFDYYGDLSNLQILITYEPNGGQKFVSFSWPGWIGVHSGMNESGIGLMCNMGNGSLSSGSGPFHPSQEVFRYILENTTAANYLTQPLSIVNSVEEYSTFNIQIVAPNTGNSDPVYYIEDSSTQNVIRYAADTDPNYNHIIATNHFMKVSKPPSSDESVDRYNTIRSGLISLYQTGDGKVDSTEAFSLLGRVAISPLTSIVIRPNRMEFDLSFARWTNGGFDAATGIQPQTYSWATLFPNHGLAPSLPDLIVQSINIDPAFPVWGQPMTVTATVKNQGNADSGSYQVDFYSNLTSAPTLHQIGDSSLSKGSLAAGATDICVFTVTYPVSGNYKAWVQVDTEQQVNELNETNNVLSTSINSTNTPPVAVNDAYSTNKNTILNIPATGVLGNDTDADNDPLTAVIVAEPAHGMVTLNSDGSFIYNPAAGYAGSDSFTYRAYDGKDYSNDAKVSITIINTAPVAVNDTYSANRNSVLNIASPGVLKNDTDANGDALTASLVSGVTHGALTLNSDGSFIYNPTAGYTGSDSFTYRAYDGKDYSNNAKVSITITNTAPVSNNQLVTTDEDTAKSIILTATDAENDPLTYSIVKSPTHGSLSGTAPNLTYTPVSNYNGKESFTFKTNDGKANSNVATVTITVNPVNDAPVSNNQLVTTNQNATKAITLTAKDVDGNTLTYSIVAYPTNGTLSGTPPNVTYIPNANYNGIDSFTFKANDGILDSNIATVSITVYSNLALSKPATTDSEQTSLGNTASKGNDGNSSTRWSANDGLLNHWWKVDLGASYTLTGTKVIFQYARNYKYKIEVSTDNVAWTIVVDQTKNTSTSQTRQNSFNATLGRYVRITYTGLPSYPTTWASHYEFEVYGN